MNLAPVAIEYYSMPYPSDWIAAKLDDTMVEGQGKMAFFYDKRLSVEPARWASSLLNTELIGKTLRQALVNDATCFDEMWPFFDANYYKLFVEGAKPMFVRKPRVKPTRRIEVLPLP